jgi:hypothetical protein
MWVRALEPVLGSAISLNVAMTSPESSSLPWWNLTPLRRVEGPGLEVRARLPALGELTLEFQVLVDAHETAEDQHVVDVFLADRGLGG